MNYYKFHVGDYLVSTAHLTWEEDLALRRLLDVAYKTERPLPIDIDQVCRLVRASSRRQREAVDAVLREYFEAREDGWHNRRCEREIAAASAQAARSREFGKLGGRPRKNGAQQVSRENLAGFQMEPEAKPTKTPEASTHTPLVPDGGDETPCVPCPYDQFIEAYHSALPSLPRVRLRSPARDRAMRNMWGWILTSRRTDGSRRAENANQALTWIADYFARAARNDFLMGRVPRSAGHALWTCDFDFLLTEKGMKHVIEKTEVAA